METKIELLYFTKYTLVKQKENFESVVLGKYNPVSMQNEPKKTKLLDAGFLYERENEILQ